MIPVGPIILGGGARAGHLRIRLSRWHFRMVTVKIKSGPMGNLCHLVGRGFRLLRRAGVVYRQRIAAGA